MPASLRRMDPRELTPRQQRKLRADVRVLATFARVYCHQRHAAREHQVAGAYVAALADHGITGPALCAECGKLLSHAVAKRATCPFDPKPMCKQCPEHCYAPHYREQIREVMKVAGRTLVLRGRLDYLWHLFR